MVMGEPEGRAFVRRALEQCARKGWRIQLASARRTPRQDQTVAATIEQVRESDFVISRPMNGAHHYPLAIGEPLRLTLICSLGHCSAAAKVVGRFKMPSGGTGGATDAFYGYRLSMPETLVVTNRRRFHRTPAPLGPNIHMTLHPVGCEPLIGDLLDISAGGMRLRLRDPDALLIDGQQMLVTGELSGPSEAIAQMIRVVRTQQCDRTNCPIVAVSFDEEVQSVAEFVRRIEIQRRNRAGAA
jgi:hypothetical protein